MCLINFSKFQKTHVNFMKFAGKTMVALKYKKNRLPLIKIGLNWYHWNRTIIYFHPITHFKLYGHLAAQKSSIIGRIIFVFKALKTLLTRPRNHNLLSLLSLNQAFNIFLFCFKIIVQQISSWYIA